jgi:DNA-binding NarL/FixJ family response regulator
VPPEGGGPGERVGLRGMRERVALLGGEFSIHSRPGAGTSVVAEIRLLHATPVHEEPVPGPRRETSPPARLVIADDQAVVREGLRTMLANEPNIEVVGEVADGNEALELCRSLQPDLVLMDVRMPRMDGLAATRAIRSEGCATSILMLSTYEDPDYLFETVRAGASGYILKDAGRCELIGAIREALGGENPMNQRLAMQLLRRLANGKERATGPVPERGLQPEPLREPLTRREVEVLRFLAQGQTNRQISRQLVISPATVKVHVEHILAKLEVSDRTQAAVRASEIGLLVPKR